MSTATACTLSGIGLITGQESTVEIKRAESGRGITFYTSGVTIPARPDFVVNADRGVTLGHEGKTLSLVEHFLSAASMTGHWDLDVMVAGAPELPILDGSALPWAELLDNAFGPVAEEHAPIVLEDAIFYQDPDKPEIQILCSPANSLSITYMVDFNHPDLTRRWYTWRPGAGSLLTEIAPARTFGFVAELPELQKRGLALGASTENTLGLTEDGGYTSELRMPLEPIRHKVLDFIGDMMLSGIPVSRLNANIALCCAGHKSHLAFARLLKQALGS